jgi:uncharacterized membrane protein
MTLRSRVDEGLLALVLAFAGLVVLAAIAAGKAWRGATIDYQPQTASRVQVFHSTAGAFSEADSTWFRPGPGAAPLWITARGEVLRWVRLDPSPGVPGRLCGVALRDGAQRAPARVLHVSGVRLQRDGACLRVEPDAGAIDPLVVLRLAPDDDASLAAARRWQVVARSLLLASAVLALVVGLVRRRTIGQGLRALPQLEGMQRLDARLHLLVPGFVLAIGAAYALLSPPNAVPDEMAHLVKVQRIVAGVPLGGWRALRLPDAQEMYGPFGDMHNGKEPFTRASLHAQLAAPLRCAPEVPSLLAGANGYSPHHYLAPVIAYRVACATGASFGGMLHAARLGNLLLSAALVWLGLRWARRGRWGLAAVSLLPASLFAFASISADALVLALGIAWLGLTSGLASGALDARRLRAALWLLSLAIAFLKPGSAWVLASLLFCRASFPSTRAFVLALGLHLLLPLALHVGFTLSVSGEAPHLTGADPAARMQALLHAPMEFVGLAAATLHQDATRLAQMLVGILGWIDIPLGDAAYWTAAALLLACLADSPPRAAGTAAASAGRRAQALLAVVILLGAMLLPMLPLYIYWTPIGWSTIGGLQGRYYLVALAFALCWLVVRAPAGLRTWLLLPVLPGLVAINAHAVWRVWTAYFITGR